ncbi:MAG TPA: hypothetical protein VLX61_13720 [Anaerolineales bacterium]|nr:hypothetical protein [Anaerolineales bacterium]
MLRYKSLLALFLATAMMIVQVASASAAPMTQSSTLTGTVQSCSTSTDTYTGAIIVVCTIAPTDGSTQTVSLSAADAQTLGLATVNSDGSVTITATAGQAVAIDTSLLLSNPCTLPTGANQPVGVALTNFFCKNLGLDYNTVQTLHQGGFGYGEIAQACFTAQVLGLPGQDCQTILQDKQSGDFSNLTLPGGAAVSNWGQLRKDVLGHEAQNMSNLGAIMSGRAAGTGSGHGHGNGYGNGNGNGHGHGH